MLASGNQPTSISNRGSKAMLHSAARNTQQNDKIVVELFFNDDSNEALLSQVQWFQLRFNVGDNFFQDMLNIERAEFAEWKYEHGFLSKDKQNLIREFWQMMLHLMSFYDYDMSRMREVFQREALGHQEERSHSNWRSGPPWIGTSLKNYLEKTGPRSIRKVNRWIQALRYANWY